MQNSRLVKISKYLSYHLRHHPEAIDIKLGPGGWVSVTELLSASAKHGFAIEPWELKEVVAQNDKQRFSFDSTGTLIRANQGHSIEVDLALPPALPPEILYHGTGHRAVESILTKGLLKMSRHHVHLSADVETARLVGQRHGRSVVFAVMAAQMHQDGHQFFLSDNGVWLVDMVPTEYLQQM